VESTSLRGRDSDSAELEVHIPANAIEILGDFTSENRDRGVGEVNRRNVQIPTKTAVRRPVASPTTHPFQNSVVGNWSLRLPAQLFLFQPDRRRRARACGEVTATRAEAPPRAGQPSDSFNAALWAERSRFRTILARALDMTLRSSAVNPALVERRNCRVASSIGFLTARPRSVKYR
jgi:hypothetical protein